MNPSQRLVLNTAASYSRSVFSLALALFSSRWVLHSLGQTDYGLFSLVGSVIVFITFLNGIMANSVSRYFAYSIGQGDSAEVTRWFNTGLSIHLCFGFSLILIGWPVGEYVIGHVLNIPAERIATSFWVFRVSLVSAFASMVSVPFVAMFTAKQHIAEVSGWGGLQSILAFTLAYGLTRYHGDCLLFYAVGVVIIIVFIQAAMVLRALLVFPECRVVVEEWFDRHRLSGVLSFTTWNLIGGFGTTFRDQGSAILLNLHFGPGVNAAFGVAKQVSEQTNQLSASMLGAFYPEITTSEGRGDRDRTLGLSHRASKYGTILVLLFAIPLIVEMDYILKLWLREPPAFTALFCRLILCTFLVDRSTTGYMMAVNARGKVAGYQATVGGSLVLTLPLAWVFLKLGYPPTSVGSAFIITAAICSVGRVLWVRRLFGEPVEKWVGGVLLPCIVVGAAATLAALVPHWLMSTSFIRLVCVSGLSVAGSLLATWFLAFDSSEHAFIRQNRRDFLRKVSRACTRS